MKRPPGERARGRNGIRDLRGAARLAPSLLVTVAPPLITSVPLVEPLPKRIADRSPVAAPRELFTPALAMEPAAGMVRVPS